MSKRSSALALLGLSLAQLGCQRPERMTKAAPPLLAPTHYLDEPFALGTAQCRLLSATPMLTESISDNQDLAAEDVSVVELSFACEDARGTPVPFSSLPARLTWIDRARAAHAPTTTTTLGRTQREHVVFQVPSGQDGLLRTRRYDANTGAPVGPHEPGSARLYLEPSAAGAALITSLARPTAALAGRAQARVVIAPWPRLHDDALDALLDRLARTLASETSADGLSETETGHAAIATVRKLYRQTLERFAPNVLALRAIENVEGQPRLTLSLDAGARGSDVPPSTSFSLELAPGARGLPTVVRLLDPEGTRNAVECAIQSADLRARVERAENDAAQRTVANAAPEAHCNALGVLLPHACPLADVSLLHAALRVQTRCRPSGALGLNLHEASSAPSDFEVKLRRGASLDSRGQGRASSEDSEGGPRYSVALSHSGQVLFEGLHASSRELSAARAKAVEAGGPREGRTSQALLSALWGYLTRLDWLEREPATGKHCTDGERGDAISVLAHGRTLSVRDKPGCRAGFSGDELLGLRRAIEHVAAVEAWTTPSAPVFSRAAEIWVVAAE